MIAQELEVSLHMAFVAARQKRHEFITVEHLLLALLDNPAAGEALLGCGANMDALRRNLRQHIAQSTSVVAANREVDTQPTGAFQRVIQRAILNVQSAGKKEVNGTDVLCAIFGEKDCHAERLLRQQSITVLDVANYVSHGITKTPQSQHSEAVEDSPATSVTSEAGFVGGPIDQELEAALQATFADARQKRHEFITVEHLLTALVDHPTAAEVLRACGADIDELRKELDQHIAEHTPPIAADRQVDTQPTLGFHRVIQRAVLHMQASAKKELNGANVLVAIFGEKDSHALFFLHKQGITRLNVVNYLAHGVAYPPWTAETADAGDVRVVLYDDQSTPMEFMARVLQEFFGMDKEEAADTMLEIYRDGRAVCGLYSREDGEALARQVTEAARANGHVLICRTAAAK
jgi:ATP-dependent Clp protease ATP-binding subunit ClpA